MRLLNISFTVVSILSSENRSFIRPFSFHLPYMELHMISILFPIYCSHFLVNSFCSSIMYAYRYLYLSSRSFYLLFYFFSSFCSLSSIESFASLFLLSYAHACLTLCLLIPIQLNQISSLASSFFFNTSGCYS